jgi:hypothetical protein
MSLDGLTSRAPDIVKFGGSDCRDRVASRVLCEVSSVSVSVSE